VSRIGPSQGENPLQPPSHARRRQWRGTWEDRDGMLWSPLLGSLGLVAGFTTRSPRLIATAVIVTVVMFRTLYIVLG